MNSGILTNFILQWDITIFNALHPLVAFYDKQNVRLLFYSLLGKAWGLLFEIII